MADNLKERIAEMKEAATRSSELLQACEESWYDSHHLQVSVRFVSDDADFIAACNPDFVLGLIAEIERLQIENMELKAVAAGLGDVIEGRTKPLDQIRKELGIKK